MLGKEENWFQKHRGFILGFAIAVVLLNIALFILLPSETAVVSSGTGVEYSTADEAFAAEHEVQLSGTLVKAAFRPSAFAGELHIDGAAWALYGTHDESGWKMEIQPSEQGSSDPGCALLDVRGDRDLTTVVLLLEGDGADDVRFLSLAAGNRAAALRQLQSRYPEICG